jgi:hypothetical protein
LGDLRSETCCSESCVIYLMFLHIGMHSVVESPNCSVSATRFSIVAVAFFCDRLD